jgi:uncharacterized protein (TIGR03083 family)
MQLQPRYGGEPILTVDGVTDPSAALLRQRRRLLATLESLDDAQWATPSRCEEWTTQGVITHLISTDGFWGISFSAGLRGEPTTFLGSFDPVASPAQMVQDQAGLTAAEVLDRYRAALDGFVTVVDAVPSDAWTSARAEAPPGHLCLAATALHALWDGWIHERDIAIPLGLPLTEDPEEIALILRYVAGLSPSFRASTGTEIRGVLAIEATDPDLALLVHAGPSVRVADGDDPDAPRLAGRAVDLIEGLSHRAPLAHDLTGEDAWWLRGLAEVFDVQP